jgi:hypothetical protein
VRRIPLAEIFISPVVTVEMDIGKAVPFYSTTTMVALAIGDLAVGLANRVRAVPEILVACTAAAAVVHITMPVSPTVPVRLVRPALCL